MKRSTALRRITHPVLWVDRARTERNIRRMAEKAASGGVRFRPHFKTHQSSSIAAWFRPFGVDAIAVSSFQMAEYFASHGWNDIQVAFPFNVREIEAANRLAAAIGLHVLVGNLAAVDELRAKLRSPTNVWIDIDTGYGRTGIPSKSTQRIEDLAKAIERSPVLKLVGLYGHAGNTYEASNTESIVRAYEESRAELESVRENLSRDGRQQLLISTGDTPGCSLAPDLGGVDEVHPGNFVFYDLAQLQLGACAADDIAVVAACPIVSIYTHREEMAIHGGAVHLSKESLMDESGRAIYGKAIRVQETGWDPHDVVGDVVSISQEVGIVRVSGEAAHDLAVGDVLGILPVHSCLTASAIGDFWTVEGELLNTLY